MNFIKKFSISIQTEQKVWRYADDTIFMELSFSLSQTERKLKTLLSLTSEDVFFLNIVIVLTNKLKCKVFVWMEKKKNFSSWKRQNLKLDGWRFDGISE